MTRWLLALLLLASGEALARPGGGEGYSTGPSGGGDGGGDLPFALVRLLLWLVFEHPILGVPIAIAVIVWLSRARAEQRKTGWTVGELNRPVRRPVSARSALAKLKEIDPDFSLVLFEDFVYALYARAHEARGHAKLDGLSPWLSEAARGWLAQLGVGTPVEGIVIGRLSIRAAAGVRATDAETIASVELESNYLEGERRYYAVETWMLSRKTSARSRPPERVATFDCPSCGAKLAELREPRCAYCGAALTGGQLDWLVTGIAGQRRTLGPRLGEVEERGTALPTLVDPDASARLSALLVRDPELRWEAIEGRVRLIHDRLNAAWAARDLRPARPYLTERLFSAQQYWVECYRAAGQTNRVEGARVLRVELAALDSDKWYDALTVRLFASGRDVTTRDADGTVVAGSALVERPYSEYWTLVRGSKVSHAATTTPNCPSCGASLDGLGMSGDCAHCGARLSSGAFDWVLSRIEQDESYTG